MMTKELLEERGIFYTRSKKGYPGFIPFIYIWKYKDGQSGEKIIWCKNTEEFLELLIYWSTENWTYSPKKDKWGYVPVVATQEDINGLKTQQGKIFHFRFHDNDELDVECSIDNSRWVRIRNGNQTIDGIDIVILDKIVKWAKEELGEDFPNDDQ